MATTVMRVPGEFGHAATCFMQAQAFAQEFGDTERAKNHLRTTIDDSIRRRTIK
jgi:hypothetical protein